MAHVAAVIGQDAAPYLARAAIAWAGLIRRYALTLGARALSKTTCVYIVAAAAAGLAMAGYQTGGQRTAIGPDDGADRDGIVSVAQQSIVFRRDVPVEVEPERFEEQEGEAEALQGRPVETVRFYNSAPAQSDATLGEPIMEARGSTNAVPPSSGKGMYRGEGIASWYGSDFHGHKTANGERYNMNGISAAHRTMPLPSYARVTNLDNGRSIIVRVNNRGPYVRRRVIDVSPGAAKALDFYKKGTTHVRVEFVGRAPAESSDDGMLLATLRTGTPAPVPAEVMVASAGGGGRGKAGPLQQ